ncbi:S-layer homology domain-containing protein [Bacillus tianshenii]|nr:S-layer homology domain-containing protein [Bacillus tianshenii]
MKRKYLIWGSLAAGLFLYSGGDIAVASEGESNYSEEKRESGIVAGELGGNADITINEDGTVKVSYTAKNQTPYELDFTFHNGLKVDYILSNSEGEVISQYSNEVMTTQAIETITLKQAEEINREFLLKDLKPGSYSIKLFLNVPEQNGMVTKTFSIEQQQSFKDITADFWAYDEIDYLANREIIAGYPDGSFKPNLEITNAQAIIMLTRVLNHSDKAKEIVIQESLTNNPDEPLTRKVMAEILADGFQLEEGKGYSFSDVSPSNAAVAKLAANGITTGFPDGTFKPDAAVTRAQFAVFTARAMNEHFRNE